MTTTTYKRSEYSLFVTGVDFEIISTELRGYTPSVDSSSYEKVALDECASTYISKNKPNWFVRQEDYPNCDFSFSVAQTGDWYEDDYTRVEVTSSEIIYTEK